MQVLIRSASLNQLNGDNGALFLPKARMCLFDCSARNNSQPLAIF